MSLAGAGARNIYFVLDDSEHGYGVHCFDSDEYHFEVPDDTGDDSALVFMTESLPPPVFRLEAPRCQAMLFKALGTKIFATHPSPTCAIPAYDTRTQVLIVGPRPPASVLRSCSSLFVPVGDRLYALDGSSNDDGRHSFEVLSTSGHNGWSWSSVPSPPPFDPSRVTSYAAHPDGRSFFVSVTSDGTPGRFFPPFQSSKNMWLDAGSTFSFNTVSLEWCDHGNWMLPFQGQGHYDVELDAWVGICRNPTKPGRLCSCDVLPCERGVRPSVPTWKLGKDVLFCKNKECHRGAALEYMGSGSKFCLFECVEPKEEEPRERLMYVRMFCLKYGKDGELRTATGGRWGRCFYLAPEAFRFGTTTMAQKIAAFCM